MNELRIADTKMAEGIDCFFLIRADSAYLPLEAARSASSFFEESKQTICYAMIFFCYDFMLGVFSSSVM